MLFTVQTGRGGGRSSNAMFIFVRIKNSAFQVEVLDKSKNTLIDFIINEEKNPFGE